MAERALPPEMERMSGLLERSRRAEAAPRSPHGPLAEALQRLEADVIRAEQEQASTRRSKAADRPRYVHGEWNHIFSGRRGTTETRWVFDRIVWRLVALQVREGASRPWQEGLAAERADVEASLTSANEEGLWACDEYGLAEGDAPPEWAETLLPRTLPLLLDEA